MPLAFFQTLLNFFLNIFSSPFTVLYIFLELSFFIVFIIQVLRIKKSINEIEIEKIRNFINFWPNFFVILGILGTFIGIILGISNLNFQNETTLKNSINSLLSSMGTAFYSSIFGIIFSLFSQLSINELNQKISEFSKKSSDKILDEIIGIRNDIKELTEVFSRPLETISENAGQTVEKYAQRINEINESFTSNFNKNISIFSNTVSKISEEISNQLESIRQQSELIERKGELIQKQGENLQKFSEIIENSKNSFNEILNSQNNIVNKMNELIDLTNSIISNQENFEKLNKNVSNLIEKLEEFIAYFNTNINNFINSISEINNKVPNQMILNYKKAFEEMELFTRDFFSKLKDITAYLDESIENFDSSLKEFNETLLKVKDEIQNSIELFGNTLISSLDNSYTNNNNNFDKLQE
jgi:DNA repair ATPase RecN